jgi:biofilm PGA synthesis lipoprotein PgaB
MNTLHLFRTTLALLFFSAAFTANAASHCVILQYHHFSNRTPAITSVTPEQFEVQLDYLETNHFNILPLQEVVQKLRNNQSLPDKCIALTVDDAWSSVYETAFPKLKARGWPMTVFVNTQAIDENQGTTISWQQIREMTQHGFSFENHGHAHDHLIRKKFGESDDQWKERVTKNILTASKRITQETAKTPRLFAYPYGEFTPELKQIVTGLALTGLGQQSGPAWSKSDFGALPRFPIAGNHAKLSGFITKVNSLPLPLESASPENPVVQFNEWRPQLTLHLDIEKNQAGKLNCFVNGNPNVSKSWLDANTVQITPEFNLSVGRNRTNCTLPSGIEGRYHWYSHNWIRKQVDGNW